MKSQNLVEKELIDAFMKFIDRVKKNTILKRDGDNQKVIKEEPKYSEKAKTLDDLITKSKFGCKEENLRKIISVLIDEKIPPKIVKRAKKKTTKYEKYKDTFCIIKTEYNKEITVISTKDDATTFNAIGHFYFLHTVNKPIRYAEDHEIEVFINKITDTIKYMTMIDMFKSFDSVDDNVLYDIIGIDLVEEYF